MNKHQDPSQTDESFSSPKGAAWSVLGALVGAILGYAAGLGISQGNASDGPPDPGTTGGWILTIFTTTLGLALGAVLAWFAAKTNARTRNEERDWCRRHGWIRLGNRSPFTHDGFDFESPLKHSNLLWKRGGWSGSMVRDDPDHPAMYGARSIQEILMATGDADDDRKRSLFVVVRTGRSHPSLLILPEKVIDLKNLVSNRSRVEFESADFNRHWKVYADDAREASAILDEETIEFLGNTNPRKMPAIEIAGDLLILRYDHTRFDPTEPRTRFTVLRWMESLLRTMPDDLVPSCDLLRSPSSASESA